MRHRIAHGPLVADDVDDGAARQGALAGAKQQTEILKSNYEQATANVAGNQVSYNGHTYQAKWWTQEQRVRLRS